MGLVREEGFMDSRPHKVPAGSLTPPQLFSYLTNNSLDQLGDSEEVWPIMYWAAEGARLYARSKNCQHRKFYVGCTGHGEDELGQWRLAVGYNSKSDVFERKCAEMRMFDDARRIGLQRITRIFTVGPHQIDDHSGVPSKTLHPCKYCRDLFRQMLLEPSPIISRETVIMTALPPEPNGGVSQTYEKYTLGQMLDLHSGNHHPPKL